MRVSPTWFPCFHGLLGQSLPPVAHILMKWLASHGSGRATAQMLNSCIFRHRNAPILPPAMQVAVTAPGGVEGKQPQKAVPPSPPRVPQQKSSWMEWRRSQLNSSSILFPTSGNHLFAQRKQALVKQSNNFLVEYWLFLLSPLHMTKESNGDSILTRSLMWATLGFEDFSISGFSFCCL